MSKPADPKVNSRRSFRSLALVGLLFAVILGTGVTVAVVVALRVVQGLRELRSRLVVVLGADCGVGGRS